MRNAPHRRCLIRLLQVSAALQPNGRKGTTMLVTIETLPPTQDHTTAQHWDTYAATGSRADLSYNSRHRRVAELLSWAN
ncbi:hypothetical protein BPAE_0198g00070 [Botrytis paeoniae]|uniref:Uncharacterized protein n=1 Tax=Botrytis paeoniae TaxID=278948 RepID=A0A4Z1FJV1_9HELO|nr:hypothetical protein BPAE_0198g00070 [Botrytis paeoniae]